MEVREIIAFAEDKRYGAVLNSRIAETPKGCWIVVRDYDTMYLTHHYHQIIQEAIEDHPEATLMSCRTNRAYGQGYSPITDMVTHYQTAVKRSAAPKRYTPVAQVLPGFFWLFPRKTWERQPFDDHPIIWGNNSFDTRWCRQLTWGRKYIIERLYVFHYYRLHDLGKRPDHLR